VTAAVLSRPREAQGLRRVDPRRDLAALGRLIESAFAGHLDDSGRRMVQSMRAFGRWGWLGWAAGHLFLPPAAYPDGYVWFEGGRMVGNASLMRVDEAPRRWVLINVAVDPAWRRRGIASSLVQACVAEVRRRGAREILLQVEASDRGAQDLYARFGFVHVTTRATWSRNVATGTAASGETLEARSRRPGDNAEHLALVQRLHPEGLLWPRPLDADVFRRTLGFSWGRHWVWPRSGPMRASLSAFPGYEALGAHLVLVLDGEARGQAEAPLLDMALADMSGPIRLEADHANEETLRRYGFHLERRLVWMALALEGTKAPGRQGATEEHDERRGATVP
jgi:ribosomal protein S18 acetylase RimI-like enzyme